MTPEENRAWTGLLIKKHRLEQSINKRIEQLDKGLFETFNQTPIISDTKKFLEENKFLEIDEKLTELRREHHKLLLEIDHIQNKNKKTPENQYWVLRYPDDLGLVDHKMNYLVFTFYEYQTDMRTNEKLEKIVYPKIQIPLSARLLYTSMNPEYQVQALGQLNNVLFNNAREYGATAGGIYNAIDNVGNIPFYGEPSGNNMLEGFAMSQLLRTDLNAVKAGYQATGLAYNQNITAKYIADNPKQRIFFPSWSFVPKKRKDAETLADIIRAFKKNTLPGVMNSSMNKKLNFANHFRYPRILRLDLYIGGKIHKKVKFLPMVIERYEISNNDKVASTLSDGEMALSKDNEDIFNTETTLNLTLKELSVFTRDHVDDVFQVN